MAPYLQNLGSLSSCGARLEQGNRLSNGIGVFRITGYFLQIQQKIISLH